MSKSISDVTCYNALPANFPSEKRMKYYEATILCNNCKKKNLRYILKGIRINSINLQCYNCGCENQQP